MLLVIFWMKFYFKWLQFILMLDISNDNSIVVRRTIWRHFEGNTVEFIFSSECFFLGFFSFVKIVFF